MALKAGKRRGVVAEINVTPLTDVFLVLLIIFMVTTSAVIQQSMSQVHLPKAKSEDDVATAVTIALSGDKSISVGGRLVGASDAQVVAALRDALDASQGKTVVLAGDEQASLTDVVRLLGLAKQAGASGFALATEQGQ